MVAAGNCIGAPPPTDWRSYDGATVDAAKEPQAESRTVVIRMRAISRRFIFFSF
jgi:hypothetical protein